MSAPPAAATPRVHSAGRVVRNTLSLAIGRNAIALLRLAVLAIIARGLGTETFGQYALLVALMQAFEGLLDFGSNEIFVREVSSQPARRTPLLRILAAGRLLQAPLAWALLVATTLALGYERPIVEAAAIGGAGLFFFAGVLVYRVIFRTELTMEREIGSELVSVVAFIGAVFWVADYGGGIVEVMACHAGSRAVYFAMAWFLGRREFAFSIAGVTRADLAWSWRLGAAVGVLGLIGMAYDPIDILLLSKLRGFADTAHFSAAQRLAWPLLMTLAAVGGTLYSVASAAWPHDRARLERVCQRGLDVVILVGLAAVAAGMVGADFLMGLIGPEMVAGAPAFRILVVLCVVKSISMTLGPVLLVVRAQRAALAIVATALAVKVAVCLAIVPRFGFMGLAWTALAVETACVAIPAVIVVSNRAGIRLRLGIPIRAALICAIAVLGTQAWLGNRGILPLLVAPAIYLALALGTSTLKLSELRALKGRETAA
ncbi:MAG TPA: oligosaccharide flippase family protein [Usitatibacter sp.]|nr:oligosaccharide flippase family protein [Usitatibacter sp.]